jgi:hypothetical protein
MGPQNQSKEIRNHFYPNCGCDSQTDCVDCLHCGMCVTSAESCACRSLPAAIGMGLRYDPHQEILGG